MIRTLLVNTGSNMAVLIVKLAITFIMTPIFVRNLGNHDYGLWEMLGAIIGYMGLIEMGIRPAVSRYAAHYHALQDDAAQRETYSTAWLFMLAVGTMLGVLFYTSAALWPELLSDTQPVPMRYVWLLMIIGTELFFVFPGYIAESYLDGFQKYYLKNAITVVNSVLGALILYHYITPENGLMLLALINALGMSSKYLIFALILSRPRFGRLKPSPGYFRFVRLTEILTFGSKSLIQGIATRIENATDSLVIGAFMGPASVPFYSIPANLVQYIRTIGWTLTHAFMPLFAAMNAKGEAEQISEVYLRASRIVVGLLGMLAACVVVLGGPFIGLWIGQDYAARADVLVPVLTAFTVLPLLNPFQSRVLTAMNKHGIYARWQPVSAAINLGLSLWWVQIWGIEGVAVASLVPALLFFPFFLRYVCRALDLPLWCYFRNVMVPALVPAAVILSVGSWGRQLYVLDDWKFFLATACILAAAGLVMFVMVTLQPDERRWMWSKLARYSVAGG